MKKVAILYREHSPIIDAIKYQLADCVVESMTELLGMGGYDLVVNLGSNYDGEALACHHSLLPAFNSKEPVKDAILAGIKVTGITIYYTKSNKIIAQYPVFINNNTHYDELVQELDYIEQTLFPLVIQKVLNNEPFEVRALLNKSCSGNCGGCSGCSH
jgi:phosphoribosylglycinamide formyltransferase-1